MTTTHLFLVPVFAGQSWLKLPSFQQGALGQPRVTREILGSYILCWQLQVRDRGPGFNTVWFRIVGVSHRFEIWALGIQNRKLELHPTNPKPHALQSANPRMLYTSFFSRKEKIFLGSILKGSWHVITRVITRNFCASNHRSTLIKVHIT